ncbi:MAG: mannitol dehydrogenase family protein, partial [Rhizobiales bacterium]|nr:mannitol dehydrogenase family protein [Hyphomicrobiales bacterium]
MTTPLSLESLNHLPAGIGRPAYRRDQQSPGIVHIGTGNFHRAHQAVYLDDLFNRGRDLDWAIVGAGFRPPDRAMRAALEGQDWLTTVVEREPGANRARVTGAMIDFLPVEEDRTPILTMLADPRIRIVSLTITEGGYCIDPATGRFDPGHPDIRADAASPERPSHVFGVLVNALKQRRAAGTTPFTVMSCDNIPGNGHAARDTITGFARLVDPDLAAWIEDRVAFPNSMVDRITPATTDRDRALLAKRFAIADAWPVLCEPFRQWVMQDRFGNGRPALEEVGVTFTEQVDAYELMKLRMLNGGHAAIAYPAALLGIGIVSEAMAHPLIGGFLDKLVREEVIPVVPAIAGADRTAYLDLITRRFANPEIVDTIPRLCQDGSNRQPKFILPSTRDRLASGAGVTGLALESALWCRYCHGEAEDGTAIVIDDVQRDRLQ